MITSVAVISILSFGIEEFAVHLKETFSIFPFRVSSIRFMTMITRSLVGIPTRERRI